MKKFLFILLTFLFLMHCNSSKNAKSITQKETGNATKNDTIRIANDSLEY
jgi:hypothetical protein